VSFVPFPLHHHGWTQDLQILTATITYLLLPLLRPLKDHCPRKSGSAVSPLGPPPPPVPEKNLQGLTEHGFYGPGAIPAIHPSVLKQ